LQLSISGFGTQQTRYSLHELAIIVQQYILAFYVTISAFKSFCCADGQEGHGGRGTQSIVYAAWGATGHG
jgi:hypothetical protein